MARGGMRVVCQANDAWTWVALTRVLKPDVSLTEIDIPDDESCFTAIAAMRAQGSPTKAIVYTRLRCDYYVKRAKDAGAYGYLTKDETLDTVAQAIRAVMAGRRFFAERNLDRTIADVTPDLPKSTPHMCDVLSPCELEVARLLSLGLSVKQVAADLHRSMKTVEAHKTRLMAKLAIHDRVALSRLAIREGLVCA